MDLGRQARPPGIGVGGKDGVGAFLADFGLAKTIATGSRLTRTGEALGTPAYMSPEQARGEVSALTPATDVWSLGCVLHEILAGRSPFEGETPAAVVGRVLFAEPPRLARLRPDVPGDVERVVRACLEKRVPMRYPGAEDLRDDFDRLLRGERPRSRPTRLRGWLAGAAVLGAAAALGLVLPRGAGRASVTGGPAEGPRVGSPRRSQGLADRAWALRQSDPAEAARLLASALEIEPGVHAWRLERGLLVWATRAPRLRSRNGGGSPTMRRRGHRRACTGGSRSSSRRRGGISAGRPLSLTWRGLPRIRVGRGASPAP